jgi:hypothetical protein
MEFLNGHLRWLSILPHPMTASQWAKCKEQLQLTKCYGANKRNRKFNSWVWKLLETKIIRIKQKRKECSLISLPPSTEIGRDLSPSYLGWWPGHLRTWARREERELDFCPCGFCSLYLFSLVQVLSSSNVRTQEPHSLATRFMMEVILQGALCPSPVTLAIACGAVRSCCVWVESAGPGIGHCPPVLVGHLLFFRGTLRFPLTWAPSLVSLRVSRAWECLLGLNPSVNGCYGSMHLPSPFPHFRTSLHQCGSSQSVTCHCHTFTK